MISANAQVRVPFMQRTSSYTPTTKIYNIKGDFTMIGNTILTLENYGDLTLNNNNKMQYVDVDDDSKTFNSSSADLTLPTENDANSNCSTIIYAGLYWTGKSTADGYSISPETFPVSKMINGSLVTKTLNKRTISLKGPKSNTYTQFTASPNNIYYPSTSDAFIYTAYTEVTDYVRLNGIGTYFAADIALTEGNGGSTGYSGGWGLVVVYENAKMKNRNITLFDGYAVVLNSNPVAYNLPVTGFNTIPFGTVGIKLGIMASEGDAALTGDYFQIQKNSDGNYLDLCHEGNTVSNFFNSSISTGGNSRNPSILNNTGIDINMFSIPNSNNAVIGNNQTSTNFKYGTNGDTYAIFAIALAVDTYKPEVEGILSLTTINNLPLISQPYTCLPGQEIEFNLKIKNIGSEAINNTKIVVPIPSNASYVSGSAEGTILFASTPRPNPIYFDATLGDSGSLVWDLGTLPLPLNSNTLLAKLTFKLKATQDCAVLKNSNSGNLIYVRGYTDGVGAITGIAFNKIKHIQGYNQNGSCLGDPIIKPLEIEIDASKCKKILANDDVGIPINGAIGGISFENVLINDTINEEPALASQVKLSFVNTTNNGISLSGSNVIVAPGTPAGNYSLTYQINDIDNPTNSDNANVSVSIIKATIDAVDNNYIFQCSTVGLLGNILTNDNLNGIPFSTTKVTTSLLPNSIPNFLLDTSTGNLSIISGLSVGKYVLQYKIFENLNSTNYDVATISITIVDTTPPLVPKLPDIIGQCSATAIPPKTTDNCAGIITGTTTNSLAYTNEGTYSINWTFDDGNGNLSIANQTVIVTASNSSILVSGLAKCNIDVDLKIYLPSLLPDKTSSGGTWIDLNNSGGLHGDEFIPNGIAVGDYIFQYSIPDGDCSKTVEITITVDDDCLVLPSCYFVIHNAFSPNNDTINDVFTIENIENTECFPTNNVEIYNRWGVLVFEIKQYNNTTRAFRGISEGRVSIDKSTELPSGTYFYIIQFTTSDSKITKKYGYLYLTR